MSKLLKVIEIFDDKVQVIQGEEAEKWDDHCTGLAVFAQVHNANPFENDPVNWEVTKYSPNEFEQHEIVRLTSEIMAYTGFKMSLPSDEDPVIGFAFGTDEYFHKYLKNKDE